MKKVALCDTITGSPQKEPGRVAPMQNLSLLNYNTEERFLRLDTTFKIISFNLSFQKLWINFAKNNSEGDIILTKVPAHQLVIPENILLKAVSGSEAEKEIEIPFPDQSIHTHLVRCKPPCVEHRKIKRVFILLTHITKSAELKVKESKEKYRTLIEQVLDGIILPLPGELFSISMKVHLPCMGYLKEEFQQTVLPRNRLARICLWTSEKRLDKYCPVTP